MRVYRCLYQDTIIYIYNYLLSLQANRSRPQREYPSDCLLYFTIQTNEYSLANNIFFHSKFSPLILFILSRVPDMSLSYSHLGSFGGCSRWHVWLSISTGFPDPVFFVSSRLFLPSENENYTKINNYSINIQMRHPHSIPKK